MNPTPAQANVRTAKVVARGDGSPIVTGTVNFYLKALTGDNAGKWWVDSSATWSASEALAKAMTVSGTLGSWTVSIKAGAWIDGVEYLEECAESGSLDVPIHRHILCGAVPAISVLPAMSVIGTLSPDVSGILVPTQREAATLMFESSSAALFYQSPGLWILRANDEPYPEWHHAGGIDAPEGQYTPQEGATGTATVALTLTTMMQAVRTSLDAQWQWAFGGPMPGFTFSLADYIGTYIHSHVVTILDRLTVARAAKLDLITAARAAKVDLITPGRLTILSPISLTGKKLELIRGDDYTTAAGQALTWTDPGTWPDLTGAAVTLTIRDLETDAVVLSKVGVAVPTGTQTATFQPTHEDTGDLVPGDETCGFDVEAVLSDGTTRVTLVRGLCSVLQDYTREA